MTTHKVGKLDAARRQIDAAIRMTFANEDPLAIHTVVAAGHRIIRDIIQKKNVDSYMEFMGTIEPKIDEAEFWKRINVATNFLKHADRDEEAILEFDEEISDFLILLGSRWYEDLASKKSGEMSSFIAWWMLRSGTPMPADLEGGLKDAGMHETAGELRQLFQSLSREESLKVCSAGLRTTADEAEQGTTD